MRKLSKKEKKKATKCMEQAYDSCKKECDSTNEAYRLFVRSEQNYLKKHKRWESKLATTFLKLMKVEYKTV